MTERRRFQVPSAPSQFVKLYPIIAEIVEELKLEGNEKFRFAVCVSEAFTNAFYHGNQSDPAKIVELAFTWDQETIAVEVSDQGAGKLQDVDLDTDLSSISPQETSGRGVAIIKSFADKVEVNEKDSGGLKVTMIWHRQAKPGLNTSVLTR